jgi:hypothetical protein
MKSKTGDFGLELRVVPYEKLHFNPNNPNKLGKKQYKLLGESFENYGFVKPIITIEELDNDGKKTGFYYVVDGEQRAKKLHEMEMDAKGIPIIICENISVVGAKAGAITFNKVRGRQLKQFETAKLLLELLKNYGEDEVNKCCCLDESTIKEYTGHALKDGVELTNKIYESGKLKDVLDSNLNEMKGTTSIEETDVFYAFSLKRDEFELVKNVLLNIDSNKEKALVKLCMERKK